MKEFCINNSGRSVINEGIRNGLVAQVQRKLEDKGVEVQAAIALHCIIHQQALCSKCLKFDHLMSDM